MAMIDVYGISESGKKVKVGQVNESQVLNPVGGTIFYIDDTADGTYSFYDSNGNSVSAPSVGSDYTGYYYTVDGASKDKYYVYDNITGWVDSKNWGYYSITTGATANTIGSGKTNTETVLSIADTSEYAANSIFTYLTGTQNAGMGANECTDWYIGNQAEIQKIIDAGILQLASSFWCSLEYDAGAAYWSNGNSWYIGLSGRKSASKSVIFIRSF